MKKKRARETSCVEDILVEWRYGWSGIAYTFANRSFILTSLEYDTNVIYDIGNEFVRQFPNRYRSSCQCLIPRPKQINLIYSFYRRLPTQERRHSKCSMKFGWTKPKISNVTLISLLLVILQLHHWSFTNLVTAWVANTPVIQPGTCVRHELRYRFPKRRFSSNDMCSRSNFEPLPPHAMSVDSAYIGEGDSFEVATETYKPIPSIGNGTIRDSTYIEGDKSYNDHPSFKEEEIENSDSFWVRKGENSFADLDEDEDVPRPTENGGYSHTQASRAKISAANKGKTPWNKGVHRSEEVKARIAAGVRAKNRERFLLKLQDMGITEEEFEEQKRKERNAKEAEKRARRTVNGGYRPTDETKRKISEILKQKFAAGEIKPRFSKPVNVRRGFTHSDETRQKISESLRKRWASDPAYRAKMVEMSNRVNASDEVRRKISESLKHKWQCDDEFRNEMMTKIATRARRVVNSDEYESYRHGDTHRANISAAMKAKWQDVEYREKTLQSLASRRATDSTADKPTEPQKKSSLSESNTISSELPTVKQKSADLPLLSVVTKKQSSAPKVNGIALPLSPIIPAKSPKQPKPDKDSSSISIHPVQPRTVPHEKVKKNLRRNSTIVADMDSTDDNDANIDPKVTVVTKLSPKNIDLDIHSDANGIQSETLVVTKVGKGLTTSTAVQTATSTISGSVDLLKTERRDLYDLLYGDDDNDDDDDEDDEKGITSVHIHDNKRIHPDSHLDAFGGASTISGSTPTLASIFAKLDDDNLDTFDPYGLDDF